MEIKYWIMVGLATALLWLVKWGFSLITTRVEKKFDEIIKNLNTINITMGEYKQKLFSHDESLTSITDRLNFLEKEVHQLQIDVTKQISKE